MLVTGSEGLIGRALVTRLRREGHRVLGLDLRSRHPLECGDIRDRVHLRERLSRVSGVIHLAAVSRVAPAERDPDQCFETNVGGTRLLLAEAHSAPLAPWVLFASSREVYGQPTTLPVVEDAPHCPVTVYGRSKSEGEAAMREWAARGVRTAIVRLSNVYGSHYDQPERVIPAFVSAALAGRPLLVRGPDRVFDFVFVDDVVRGLARVVRALVEGRTLPPLHLMSGTAVTLLGLAEKVLHCSGSASRIEAEAAPASEVSRFVGDISRATRMIGFRPKIDLQDGLSRLVNELRSAPDPNRKAPVSRGFPLDRAPRS